MEEIRLGTIGSGLIVRTILDSVARTDGIRLVAVYSRREDTGRALASEYEAKRVYTDMDAFLADETMNFVYIATYAQPSSLRAGQESLAGREERHLREALLHQDGSGAGTGNSGKGETLILSGRCPHHIFA